MKRSPVQLLDPSLEKIFVAPSSESKYEERTPSPFEYDEKRVFQFSKSFGRVPASYWNGKPPREGLGDRTFFVGLALRTNPDEKDVGPYKFEIKATGVVAVIPEKIGKLEAPEAAYQYGLALLFGMIREQIYTTTSRMKWGPIILPIASFLDDTPPPLEIEGGASADKKGEAEPRSSKKSATKKSSKGRSAPTKATA